MIPQSITLTITPRGHPLGGNTPQDTNPMETIQVRQTRHAGHCWRSRDELISDVLLWTPTHSRAKAGRPARTYIQQLCEDTGCFPEDLPEAMNDRESGERGSGISVLPARHDDDDDDFSNYIYMFIYNHLSSFSYILMVFFFFIFHLFLLFYSTRTLMIHSINNTFRKHINVN